MSDLRAVLIGTLTGIISGIIAYYATRGIDHYLARRTIRSRQRQIKQLTEELQLLEKLGVTDRSLLLFAFKMLFPLIGGAAAGMAVWMAISLLIGPPNDDTRLLFFLGPALITVSRFMRQACFESWKTPSPHSQNSGRSCAISKI
jgi:hypothetical protein